jgi:large subunit ribosomal protein L22
MEARAINRYISTSPRKMRLVIDLIRGKSVDEALHILHFSPQHASKVAEKVLRSAVSNLQNMDGGGRLEAEQMTVKAVTVDVGMTMKRISPAPMGRAFRIRKRSHHLTVVVAAKEEAVAAAKPARKQEPKPAKKGEAKPAKKEEPKPVKKEEPKHKESKPAKRESAGKKT